MRPYNTYLWEAIKYRAGFSCYGCRGTITKHCTDSADAPQWNSEVLRGIVWNEMAVLTDGALLVCDNEFALPPVVPLRGHPLALSPRTLPLLGRFVRETARTVDMTLPRRDTLLVAVSEAATNAVVHGQAAVARVGVDYTGVVQVWITDTGRGVEEMRRWRFPQIAVSHGPFQARMLGAGFEAMQAVDRLWLLSTVDGTTVVIEQEAHQATWR